MKIKILPSQIVFTLFFLFSCTTATFLKAQPPTHVPRLSPVIDYNINGFWEYLPRNYIVDVNQTYPLLIFMHGYGESGSTPDSMTLRSVLNNGTPKIIGNGTFPDSFYVAGKWFKFIVLSPQIKDGFLDLSSTVLPSTIENMIAYAKRTYRVDTSRIYMGGLSMGGGVVWDYAGSSVTTAGKLAAISIATGAADLTPQEAGNIANANLPVIATHNRVDDQILVGRTEKNIQLIRSVSPAISPSPVAVYWDSSGPGKAKHNVWTRTYELLGIGTTPGGNLSDTLGMNIYEWLLQYSRPLSLLPLVWKSFRADAADNHVSLTWETAREQNIKEYQAEKSHDGQTWELLATVSPRSGTDSLKTYRATDGSPYPDVTFYHIKQIDLDNHFSYSTIEKIVTTNNGVNSIKIYPSPFTNKLTIGFRSQGQSVVNVFLSNAVGVTVKQQRFQVTGRNEDIMLGGLQSLPSGVYSIRLTDNNGKILAAEKVFK